MAERYGPSLNSGELQQFEVLQEDYEVGWHLKALKMVISPTQEEQQSRKVAVQNRRLAFMNRLIQDGEYFSEDAMRMRAPLLHHEYVGQFQVQKFSGMDFQATFSIIDLERYYHSLLLVANVVMNFSCVILETSRAKLQSGFLQKCQH